MRTYRLLQATSSSARRNAAEARNGLPLYKLLTIVGVLCLLSGCSILEEIDKLGGGEVAAEEQGDDGCEEGSQSEACPNKPGNWWANARSLSSDEMKTDIVSCRVGNATQFTSRDSCLARGGAPASS